MRLSHRRNEGRVFDWANPPETGHPGQGFNCRCEAVPYIAGQTEFAFHEITTSLDSPHRRWVTPDFVLHYYLAWGQPVTLREIGQLQEIVDQYAYLDEPNGAFRRLSGQIASKARREGPGAFTHDFGRSYDFGDVSFSHGGGTVRGLFIGVAEDRGAMLAIRGHTMFRFHDEFKDPIDSGFEALGIPYVITGKWTASFSAEVLKKEEEDVEFFYDGSL